MGVYPSGIDETARALNEALQKAGFRSLVHESRMGIKWSKLVINLGMAVSAITGLSGPETRSFKDSRELSADLTDEGMTVLQAARITIEDEPGRPPAAELGTRLHALSDSTPPPTPGEMKHRPSPWQDLARKTGKTEIDFLNGEIVELGKKLGIPTPLNSLMVKVVKEMAEEGASPGKYSVADLRRMLAG